MPVLTITVHCVFSIVMLGQRQTVKMTLRTFIFVLAMFGVSACQSINTSETPYKTYTGLPCNFNGVQVQSINNAATLGKTSQNCCRKCKGYKTKEGQTLHTKRGRPVLAIADMTLVSALNKSAKQRTGRSGSQNSNVGGVVSRPYDDLRLEFKDTFGNHVIYYHLMSDNPFVPGFGKGACKIPLEWQHEQEKRYPSNCGGIQKRSVKKGELIGYVGSTTYGKGDHISLGIFVMGNDPRFPDQYGLVVPSHNFIWENKPTNDPMKYLLPIH